MPYAHQFCNRKYLLSNTSFIDIRKKEFCVTCSLLFDCIGWERLAKSGLSTAHHGKKIND